MRSTVSRVLKAACFSLAFVAGSALALPGSSDLRSSDPGLHQFQPVQGLPPALRPVFYQSLAKDAGAAYNLNEKGCAALPGTRLTACFNGGGAHFTGAGSLALHLLGYGRGEALAPVQAVRPVIEANRVSYAHGNLSEWWRVLPMGFEQGFTIAKRPAGRGELTLALATNNRASAHNGALGWGKLRYGQLVVTDARGKVIPATLKNKANRILIAVNDAHAAYPLTVDPLVWLEQKVTASDGADWDNFGESVSLSGATALVGTPFGTVNGNPYQGEVYIFSKSDGKWTQTAKLTASDGAAFDYFGYRVALAGTTALIGAPLASGGAGTGAAYIFSESNGTWSQIQKLTTSDGAAGDYFGMDVALSGVTALVGAPGVGGGQGTAYLFGESNGTWSQTQELTADDGAAGDYFGVSVALSGTTALIGAYDVEAKDAGDYGQGAAYVFAESNGAWTQAQKLTVSNSPTNYGFGYPVALDGATALIGAYYAAANDDGSGFGQGAAYVFAKVNGSWTQTQKLVANDGTAFDNFGIALALSGTTALVGAWQATINGNADQGAAYVFSESGGNWTQIQKLYSSDGMQIDLFGTGVALSGTTALVGSPQMWGSGNGLGAAYFYGESDLGLNLSAPQTVGQGQQYTSQAIATNNASAASPAVSATVTVPAAASFISASASQGSCGEASGVVTCDFGPIDGNAGTATANVTLKATGSVGDTIDNTASIAHATPPLSASAPTTITEGGACPEGYTEYDGNLNPGEVARSPVYQAPGGSENAILTAPARFQLYAVYQSGRFGRHVYLVPGNEVHRWGPKGLYMWLVRARDDAGAYTLCLQHP